MNSTREIRFPSEQELLQFAKGKLGAQRLAEMKFLAEKSELLRDAMEGYRWQRKQHLIRRLLSGMALLCVMIMSLFSFRYPHPVIAKRGMSETLALHSPGFRTETRSSLKEEKQRKNVDFTPVFIPREEGETAAPLFFAFVPDDHSGPEFLLKPETEDARKKKEYKSAGLPIRFVEGYMLSDHSYLYGRTLDVPFLGGVPAEFENKGQKAPDARKPSFRDYRDEVDRMISGYAQGRYKEAANQGRTWLKMFPSDVNLCFYTGMSYYQMEQYDKALYYLLRSVTPENTCLTKSRIFMWPCAM